MVLGLGLVKASSKVESDLRFKRSNRLYLFMG